MKKFALIPMILAIILLFPACMSGARMDGAEGGVTPEGSFDEQQGDLPAIRPGTLTAGEWNDNKNYDFFLRLFERGETVPEEEEDGQSRDGIFASYRDTWNMSLLHRLSVDVKSGAAACPGAKVSLFDGDTLLVSAVSDARGRAYLYPKNVRTNAEYRLVTENNSSKDTRTIAFDGSPVTVNLASKSPAPEAIDLCFAIDTTGSMGDELSYLKAEIDSVIERVKDSNPNAAIRLALVFYRDEGDLYVTKKYDFSANIAAQRAKLSDESASGGGDYPEAVHAAFSDALNLTWQEDASKMLFFVLDAPPHDTQKISSLYGTLVYRASEMGVRIVPVAASGADVLTQYLMRSAAAITNGTYIFLTDHSGVGLPHDKPVVGDFTVEYLNDCLVRVINELHTGVEVPPVSVFDKAQ